MTLWRKMDHLLSPWKNVAQYFGLDSPNFVSLVVRLHFCVTDLVRYIMIKVLGMGNLRVAERDKYAYRDLTTTLAICMPSYIVFFSFGMLCPNNIWQPWFSVSGKVGNRFFLFVGSNFWRLAPGTRLHSKQIHPRLWVLLSYKARCVEFGKYFWATNFLGSVELAEFYASEYTSN
jgi:hypothetical protein